MLFVLLKKNRCSRSDINNLIIGGNLILISFKLNIILNVHSSMTNHFHPLHNNNKFGQQIMLDIRHSFTHIYLKNHQVQNMQVYILV